MKPIQPPCSVGCARCGDTASVSGLLKPPRQLWNYCERCAAIVYRALGHRHERSRKELPR